ncbi:MULTISPECIES: hypothetical protein [Yersinia]|uniref:hypothetical protein n=1 Tax=Yersinia TaxID=629 RepID=UPI0011A19BFA|nr:MULTISPECIES: hypothetical protein [Yersinia]EKN6210047.1 hypothetical protein [Yersinia enterocolitica]UZM72755.1 hypothetical protein OP861_08975 [Yersinia intermedia]
MTRNDLEYNIYYSHYLEKMFSVITGRIDKFISFSLLMSGSAVFASFGSNVFFGFLVALLSSIALIYEFGKKSSASLEQSKSYHSLIINIPELSDDQLRQKFSDINSKDGTIWNCLSVAARKRTMQALYGEIDKNTRYTKFQYLMSWLAGDAPS